jgi:adenylate cyclase
MSGQAPRRRLAAILAEDVVGYSRLMQADEAGTLVALKSRRAKILEPLVDKFHGRVVKLMGDGALVEFASAVDAVECAVELQHGMESANANLPADRQIQVRIGINLGDVMVEGSDLYGDGVNIAARLEAMADPGSVFVSQTVFSHVRGKTKFAFEDLGEQSLKNMAEPVRVYRIGGVAEPAPKVEGGQAQPSKLSIAVLPFVNMSGDPEQEYFSDGITEDIITDLSKVSALKVLSRNTVFTFKGKSVDVGQIARQLKVGHVLEGSVRKAGGRVRITAQLIDADDSHVWAERFDRDLSDIFGLQDEISETIVAALKLKLQPEEKKAIESRSTYNPDAYQLYLLGRDYQLRHSARSLGIALRFYQQALDIDPLYARAWAMVAICQARLHWIGKSEDSGLAAAERALALDTSLAEAHAARGRVLAAIGRYEESLLAHEEALRLEPDSFDVRFTFGATCFQLRRHEAAIEHYERAAQLLETDFVSLRLATMSYVAVGRHEESIAASRRAMQRIEGQVAKRSDDANALVSGVIALARLGENERARQWALRAQAIEPDDPMDHYNLGCALAQMNEPGRALDLLEACVSKMSPEFINWVKQDTDLIPLHDHRRYKALIARGEVRLATNQTEPRTKSD